MNRSVLALASLAVLTASAGATGVSAAAADTAPAAGGTISLSTTNAPDGTADPRVEVQVDGAWVPAKAYNNGAWTRLGATGYVNATGSAEYPASSFEPTQANQYYRVAFDLPAYAEHPRLTGSMLADNVGTAYLNSPPPYTGLAAGAPTPTLIGAQPYAYSTLNFRPADGQGTPLGTSDASAFVTGGRNYLYFSVHNFDLVSGLDVDATVAYDAPVNHAPVITSVTGPAGPLSVGTPTTVRVPFTDPDVVDSHTCTFTWDDGSSSAGTVDAALRVCTGTHTFTTADVYTVSVTVTDRGQLSDTKTLPSYVVVYDPSAGFVTGGGWVDSPAGAYSAVPALTGRANFGFVAKYKKGATVPDGQTEFQFQAGDLNFHSTAYEWLVVAGARAQYKGTGTINGAGSYGFLLTAVDGQVSGGGGTDRLRLKITGPSGVVYDNQVGSSDDAAASRAITNGSIVIHS